MSDTLIIKDLHVSIEDKKILKGINLVVNTNEIHAILGPNGNGKSTLFQTIMGHPSYHVDSGSITFNGQDVLKMSVDERSKAGLFLAFQYPSEIAGVTNSDFLRAAINARSDENLNLFKFIKEIDKNIASLKMKDDLAHRFVNDGFSGGEKKKNEILQMLMLKPRIAMLDEIDSGLDVDAIKLVSEAISNLKQETGLGLIMISHYERFFNILKPTHVHVLIDGKIVMEGDQSLVNKIDQNGYDWIYKELKIEKNIEPVKVNTLETCARNPKNK